MCCSHELKGETQQPLTMVPAYMERIKGMRFFDPQIHMTSLTTDDYRAMAAVGIERIMINSAISDPLAVPKTAALMHESGIDSNVIDLVTFRNAITAFAQSGQINEADFEVVKRIDQSLKFNGII